MAKFANISLQSIVAILLATMLFSCHNRLDKVRKMEQKNLTPQIEETGIHLIYTDSGKVAAQLDSPKMLYYGQLNFPYRVFPKGVSVDFFDDKGGKNTVIADYAIVYEKTNLIDLRGNVKVVESDSSILKAHQLYWDRQRKWVFTDLGFTLKMKGGTVNNGQGFDANQKFTKFISRSNTGKHYLEDRKP